MIQVISNLLSNAVKFTKDGGGTITVTTEKKVTQAIVKVKDTRTGIDPEILPQLFSKFALKSFEGNGSRLSIAESIVEVYDGNIWVENNNINSPIEKGATFYLTLPSINRKRNVKVLVDQ